MARFSPVVIVIFVILFLFRIVPCTHAEVAIDIEMDKWWRYGWTEGIATDEEGENLYLVYGAMLRVYNISDKWNPAAVRDVPLNISSSESSRLTVSGDYLYLIGEETGLIIFNITDRTSPVILSKNEGLEGTSVFVEGNYAYIDDGGLKIVDLSDKSSPEIVGNWTPPTKRSNKAVVSNQLAYILDTYNDYIFVVNCSNPTNPFEVSEINFSGAYLHDIDIWDGYLFIANKKILTEEDSKWKNVALIVLNISNPSNPPILHECQEGYSEGVGWDFVKVDYPRIFTGRSSFGAGAFDISGMNETNPPQFIGSIFPGSTRYVRDITVAGDFCYLSSGCHCAFVIYNFNNMSPKQYKEPWTGRTFGISSTGSQFVYTVGDDFFRIFDVTTEPLEPIYIEETGGRDRDTPLIIEKDGYTYLASTLFSKAWSGIGIYNVTNPYNPTKIFDEEGSGCGKPVYNPDKEVLFQCCIDSNMSHYLRSYDLSSIENITKIEELYLGNSSGCYTYNHPKLSFGNYLYLGTSTNKELLLLYEIGANKKLSFVKELNLSIGDLGEMGIIRGKYAYLVGSSGDSLYVLNLTDPENPTIVTSIYVGHNAHITQVIVKENYTYIVSWVGFYRVNLTDISNPETIWYTTSKMGTTCTFSLNKLVCAQGEVGVKVYSLPSDSPLGDPTIRLKDPITGSTRYTSTPTVDVEIEHDENATGWLLSETQSTPPSIENTPWTTTKPTNYTFNSPVDGIKTVYVWIRDAQGNVNSGPVGASIILDTTPASFISSDPPNGAIVSELDIINFTFSDNFDFNETGTKINVTKNGIPFTDYIRDNSVKNRITLKINNPSDGTYIFEITPMDEAGNVAPVTTLYLEDRGSETIIEGKEMVDDAWLPEAIPSSNYGDYPWMRIGKVYSPPLTDRALVRFNLSSIPENSTILDAQLQIRVNSLNGSVELNLHKVEKSWKEYEVTWNKRTSADAWETPGGDFGPSIGSVNISEEGWITIQSDALTNTTREWHTNLSNNFGVLLEADNANSGEGFSLAQTEYSQDDAPRLIVTHVTPDTTPPQILNISLFLTPVTITWNTNEPADSRVKYGTSPGIYTLEKCDPSFTLYHSITLTNLTPSTTYYLIIASTDRSGNYAQTSEMNFTTMEEDDNSSSASKSVNGGSHSSSDSSRESEPVTIIYPQPKKIIEQQENLSIYLIKVRFKDSIINPNINIAEIKSLPGYIPKPVGLVYRIFQINKTNFDNSDIENETIEFKVKKTWVEANEVDKDRIYLARYNENNKSWEKLRTKKIKEDESLVYYEAHANEFSYFAIIGLKKEKESIDTNKEKEVICEEGEKKCSDNKLQICIGNSWRDIEICDERCDANKLECTKKPTKPDLLFLLAPLFFTCLVALSVSYFIKKKAKKTRENETENELETILRTHRKVKS